MANVLTNVGKKIITGALNLQSTAGSPGNAVPKYVSWGTTTPYTATATATNAAGEGGSYAARATGTVTYATTTTADDTFKVVGTLTATAASTPTNAGLFDSATLGAGNIFVLGDFTGIPLASGDSIQFTFQVAFS
jgi:hypothetical protein